MVKAAGNATHGAAPPTPTYPGPDMGAGIQVADVVAAAAARFRRDLETYRPGNPALAYALTGETHTVMLHRWRQYPRAAQVEMLKALLEDAAAFRGHLQAQLARITPTNGFMFGQQDEAIKLETQADITMEEIQRIEAALRALEADDAPQKPQ